MWSLAKTVKVGQNSNISMESFPFLWKFTKAVKWRGRRDEGDGGDGGGEGDEVDEFVTILFSLFFCRHHL